MKKNEESLKVSDFKVSVLLAQAKADVVRKFLPKMKTEVIYTHYRKR